MTTLFSAANRITSFTVELLKVAYSFKEIFIAIWYILIYVESYRLQS